MSPVICRDAFHWGGGGRLAILQLFLLRKIKVTKNTVELSSNMTGFDQLSNLTILEGVAPPIIGTSLHESSES